jgi:ectoine hydroxylase-related dioxygenase (phytanoyl-CoA dioxygenase family)
MHHSQLDDFHRQLAAAGYCILAEVIPTEHLADIRENVSQVVHRQRQNYAGAPANAGFTPSIINHDQSFAEYLADPRLLALVERLLGEHVRISFTSAIINEPGNDRGGWHADWPFNQNNAGRVLAPYPDVVMHLTTLWMLSPFDASNGGTLVMPGSHKQPTNPTAADGPDPNEHFADEINVCGSAGSVLVMDSRLWHATAPNRTDEPRVALAVRYAPWWLNLEVLRPESDERRRMCDEAGATDNVVPSIHRHVYERLPRKVQPLYRHWVEPYSKE